MTTNSTANNPLSRSGTRLSFIDRDSHFSGTYMTPNDLHIEGRYEGEIECEGTVVIAESAEVDARVSAGSITTAGHLQGEIGCRGRFEILPQGRVNARVVAGAIVVHEGAHFEGELHMRQEGSTDTTPAPGVRNGTAAARRRPATRGDAEEVPAFLAGSAPVNGRAQTQPGASPSLSDRPPTP